ncbi:diguanylate cyclase domain-containing protein [Muricoccus vinaceus]|uniref:diguanylate cyclase n=1 Tax=Muricoccus vinaceus TaxID=424704 RepID=A0ABV6IPM6_9PROT
MRLWKNVSREAAMQSASTQSRGWRLFSVPRRIALGILSLDLLVLLIGTAVLSGLRVEARRKAEHAWSSLVSTLERDLSRHLGQIDLSLRGLAATIQISEPGKRVSQSYEIALSAQAGPGRTDGLLLVLDANGTLVASSKAFSSAEQSFAGREYFEVHRQRREVGAYVSLPDTSDRGTQGIAISRRIASPDGLFRGLVVAQVPLTDLERIMSRLDLGADGTVSLLRTDGQLLARYPAANDLIVRDTVATVRRLGATLSTASAQFIATAESDGLERLYTYQRLGLPRLVLVGATLTADHYTAWWWQVGASVACFLTLHAAAVAFFLVGRGRASGRVLTSGTLPEVIKPPDDLPMDSLTGLLSRLVFESRLNQKWQHAIRDAHPLSLVILDIDHMEAYNTCFGHPAGDELLARVSACMTERVLEQGDFAARFGGNELALLLPNTDMDGASTLAELLRGSIDELGLVHAASPKARVTVSIGWSTCTPEDGQEPGLLLAAAGRALRVAKQDGRNRVAGAPAQLADALRT